jgi:hypothetical protein
MDKSEGGRETTSKAASASSLVSRVATNHPIELVFGLVGPTGVNLSDVADTLAAQLRAVNYIPHHIRLSELLLERNGLIGHPLDAYDRIDKQIEIGNMLCSEAQQKDMVARLGLNEIRETRKKITGDKNVPSNTYRIAYIVRSLKRPEEVEFFRNIYGKAFSLVSVYAPRAKRITMLAGKFRSKTEDNNLRNPQELATRIVDRDYKENENEFGQRAGKTFSLADLFVSQGSKSEIEKELGRYICLKLGDPYISPTREEQGMFFAHSAALRSLDFSRQVGAAITTKDGDILATGCNEVPKFNWGLILGQ